MSAPPTGLASRAFEATLRVKAGWGRPRLEEGTDKNRRDIPAFTAGLLEPAVRVGGMSSDMVLLRTT